MRWFCAIVLVACSGPAKGPRATHSSDGDPQTDGDADSDADTDADTDVDVDSADSGSTPGDSATDTGTPATTSPVDGDWTGSCVPPPTTTTNQTIDFAIRLDDTAGVVNGRGFLTVVTQVVVIGTGGSTTTSYTTPYVVPILLRGTFDGVDALAVDLAHDYTSGPYPMDLELAGTLSGTTWNAGLGSTLYPSYGSYVCVLERQ